MTLHDGASTVDAEVHFKLILSSLYHPAQPRSSIRGQKSAIGRSVSVSSGRRKADFIMNAELRLAARIPDVPSG